MALTEATSAERFPPVQAAAPAQAFDGQVQKIDAADMPVARPSSRASSLLAAPIFLLVFGGSVPSANEFCDGYAGQAVEYAEEAARHPTCALTGPEWDTDRDAHLAWCEALQPPELATLENAKRHAALITCLMSVTDGAQSSSVTNATDSDGADGKIGGESDPQQTGSQTPKP